MKLQTFITNYQTKIIEFETDYINNDLEAIKRDLQEFFGSVQGITGLLKEYDKADIMFRELDARIIENTYTNTFDKERDEVEKLYYQAQKYLLNKDAERNKKYLDNTIAKINIAKGV